MGKFSRDKGNRLEREVVNLLRQQGHTAERIPLSGGMGSFVGDVQWKVGERQFKLECKARANGFKFLYDNLTQDALLVKGDREKPLIVMEFDKFLSLIASLSKEKPSSSPDRKDCSEASKSDSWPSLVAK